MQSFGACWFKSFCCSQADESKHFALTKLDYNPADNAAVSRHNILKRGGSKSIFVEYSNIVQIGLSEDWRKIKRKSCGLRDSATPARVQHGASCDASLQKPQLCNKDVVFVWTTL